MSDVIEWVLEMDIQDGQANNVQPLVDEMSAATNADEPGALHYEYYVNTDHTRCTVIERYADNAGAMAHLKNFGDKFAGRFLTAFRPVRFTVYGPANDEVREARSDMGATFEERIAGFGR